MVGFGANEGVKEGADGLRVNSFAFGLSLGFFFSFSFSFSFCAFPPSLLAAVSPPADALAAGGRALGGT